MTTCARCPKELTDDSPSPDFCSDTCQDQWNRARSDPWPWVWGSVLPSAHDMLSAQIKGRLGITDNELGGAA